MWKWWVSFVFFALILSGCFSKNYTKNNELEGIFVLAGQSYPATRDYYESEVIPSPSGFSDYIVYDVGASYKPYSPEFPKQFKGNDGLKVATNWGSGIQCVACNLKHKDTHNAIINIGLYMAGPQYPDGKMCSGSGNCNVAKIATGKYDFLLEELAEWLNDHPQHTVFLRPGYEFDGPWNAYDPEQFKTAYKYIYRYLKAKQVSNVHFVFHSFGYATRETLERYYPEPDDVSESYVDWIGYSYFTLNNPDVGKEELALARRKNLNVFLGEVAPHTGDCAKQIDMSQDVELGKKWIDQFRRYLVVNRDVIKGIAYINEHWSDKSYSPMWDDQQDHNCGGFFSKSNSRLTSHPKIESHWAKMLNDPMFIRRH